MEFRPTGYDRAFRPQPQSVLQTASHPIGYHLLWVWTGPSYSHCYPPPAELERPTNLSLQKSQTCLMLHHPSRSPLHSHFHSRH